MELIRIIPIAILSLFLVFQIWNYLFSKGGIRNRYCEHTPHLFSLFIIILCLFFVISVTGGLY